MTSTRRSAGWALAISVCTLAGSAVVIGRAARAGAVLDAALTIGLGDDWRAGVEARGRRRRSGCHVVGRVLVAPVRIPARSRAARAHITYGPAGRPTGWTSIAAAPGLPGAPCSSTSIPADSSAVARAERHGVLFDRLASTGWLCISANYRLGEAGAFPNNVIDAKRVIAWLRAHSGDYGVDPSTIVMCGASAGAYLAAMCALTADDPTIPARASSRPTLR